MATLTKSLLPISGYSNQYYTYQCVVTENSYSVANNTSNVTITFSIKGPWAPSFYEWTTYYGIAVDGVVKKTGSSSPYVSTSYVQLLTWTGNVAHNSNGSKSINIGVYLYQSGPSNYLPKQYTSSSLLSMGSVPLTNIPRQATISSAPDFNDEQNPTITYSNSAGNSVSSLQACISFTGAKDDIPYRDISKTGTSYTFALTDNERNILRNSIPNSNSRSVIFYVKTVISGTTYYSTLTKTLTIVNGAPAFYASNLGYYDSNSSVTSITGNNAMIVRNKSNLMVTYTAATAKKGASISQYSFTVNGVTKTSTSAGGSINFGTINSANNLTLSAKVTDSRGNVSSTVSKIIVCYEYYAPSFTSFNAYRANSDGTADLNGDYIKWDYSIKYASVNNTNVPTVRIYGISSVAGNVTSSGQKTYINDNNTYNVYAIVTDSFGEGNQSLVDTVYGPVRTLNISPDGTNVAVGKIVQSYDADGVFDCRWKIKTGDPESTMKNLTYKGENVISSTTNDTTSNWGNKGNLATTFYNKTGQITDQPSQYGFLLNLTNGPNSPEVHQVWATQSSGSLAHRGGNSNGWNGTWRTVLDSSNYTSYVAPKPVQLTSFTTATYGTITLSQSAANFTYLEIFYINNNGIEAQSTRVYSPNGKTVELSCVEASSTTGSAYIRTSLWLISGTSMTHQRSKYIELTTNQHPQITTPQYIKITKVVGYK